MFPPKRQLAQVEQCPPPQWAHPELRPATTRPLLWAKNTESVRALCSLPHVLHPMGVSASAIGRNASKRVLQSRQTYS